MNFIKAKRLLESNGLKLISEAAGTKKYWIVTYEDPDEHYSKCTCKVSYDRAKTPAEAYFYAMLDDCYGSDEDEFLDAEGYENIEDLKTDVMKSVNGEKDYISGHEPDVCDFTFVDAELVTDANSNNKNLNRKRWIVTYEDADEHYNEDTWSISYSKAKSKGDAYWKMLIEFNGTDEEAFFEDYNDDGFPSIEAMKKAVFDYVERDGECPSCCDVFPCVSVELVSDKKA